MKIPLTLILLAVLASSPSLAGEALKLETENDNINYSLGYQIGGDLKRQQVEVNRGALLRGIVDAVEGADPLLDEATMRATLVALKRLVVEAERQRLAAEAARNLEAGERFLAKNKGRDGVVTLPSGLQYRVIKEGSGQQPSSTDSVTVHYRGTLIDGSEFDSSYSRNQPASFRADRVIAGWREALVLMQEGAEWELFIPAQLAYGERGSGVIPANSTLIFEVKLLSIDKK